MQALPEGHDAFGQGFCDGCFHRDNACCARPLIPARPDYSQASRRSNASGPATSAAVAPDETAGGEGSGAGQSRSRRSGGPASPARKAGAKKRSRATAKSTAAADADMDSPGAEADADGGCGTPAKEGGVGDANSDQRQADAVPAGGKKATAAPGSARKRKAPAAKQPTPSEPDKGVLLHRAARETLLGS